MTFGEEEDGIRSPLNSIAGLGTVVAVGIEKARREKVKRKGISK